MSLTRDMSGIIDNNPEVRVAATKSTATKNFNVLSFLAPHRQLKDGIAGPWIVNGLQVTTASNIYQLVESSGWIRQVDSGVTHHPDHEVITGLRISSRYASEAEFINHNTVITRIHRAATGSGATQYKGRLSYAEKAIREKRHIGIVVHRDHEIFRDQAIKFPDSETFAIFGGWWVMTDLWVDWHNQNGKTVKVLMAKLELVDSSTCWWLPGQSPDPDPGTISNTAPTSPAENCPKCGMPMVARYTGLLFCGRPQCDSSNSASEAQTAAGRRRYRHDYLAARVPKDNCLPSHHPLFPPKPEPMTTSKLSELIEGRGSMVIKPGWNACVCENCRVFNQRTHWAYLECRKCSQIQPFGLPNFGPNDFNNGRFSVLGGSREEDEAAFQAHIAPLIKKHNGVLGTASFHTSRYFFVVFELEANNRVMVGFPKWDAMTTYLAAMFLQLQTYISGGSHNGRPTIDLVRAPTKGRGASSSQGEPPLTGWFGCNFGVTYKTRMETPTVPMTQAPLPVKCTLRGLSADVQEALAKYSHRIGSVDLGFNEALLVGNYPSQKMNWHSDGEESVVGDVVASVSLGSLAHMSFGLQQQYYTGRLHLGKLAVRGTDPIYTGTAKEQEKRDLRAKLDGGTLPLQEYLSKMDTLVKSIKRAPGPTKTLLKFPLPFGAIMIQHGKTLNNIYLHKVEMAEDGLMRLVLTARKLSDKMA